LRELERIVRGEGRERERDEERKCEFCQFSLREKEKDRREVVRRVMNIRSRDADQTRVSGREIQSRVHCLSSSLHLLSRSFSLCCLLCKWWWRTHQQQHFSLNWRGEKNNLPASEGSQLSSRGEREDSTITSIPSTTPLSSHPDVSEKSWCSLWLNVFLFSLTRRGKEWLDQLTIIMNRWAV